MASNSEIYIANGIAANQADLEHQDLIVTLAKSVQKIAAIEDPGRRAEVAVALLGGRAQGAIPQIMRMAKVIEEEGVEALKKLGATIDDEAVAKHEKLLKSVGGVKLEIEKINQDLAENGRGWVAWGRQVELVFTKATKAVSDGYYWALPSLRDEEGRRAEHLKAQWEKEGSLPKAQEHGEVGAEGHSTKNKSSNPNGVTDKDIENQKKAAADRLAIRRLTDGAIIRSAEYVFQEQVKNDKELVASGAMTQAEMEADLRRAAKERLDTVMSALKDEEKANARMPVELRATLDKEKQAQEQYSASMLELGRQTAEQSRKDKEKADAEAEKKRKQNLELAKLGAQDELNLQRSLIESKERALDQDLAFGRINQAQWIAMKKAGVTQELKAQLDALKEEQKAADGDLVHWTKIENQKSALRRKAHRDIEKLDIEAVNRTKARWDGFFGSMTGGWDSAVKGLVKGTMTWGNALDEVLNQGLDGLISFFVRWGEEEAIKWATSLAMGSTGRVAEAEGAAAVYAVNAMGSVAAIPFWGWAAAPEVGAAAYGEGLAMAGLASAAGGWERVPSDQVAQLHKNEQVLPASYADGLRSMVASHQAGEGQKSSGGDTHIHFHGTLIDSTFWQKHQGPIVRTVNDAIKNRRQS